MLGYEAHLLAVDALSVVSTSYIILFNLMAVMETVGENELKKKINNPIVSWQYAQVHPKA